MGGYPGQLFNKAGRRGIGGRKTGSRETMKEMLQRWGLGEGSKWEWSAPVGADVSWWLIAGT